MDGYAIFEKHVDVCQECRVGQIFIDFVKTWSELDGYATLEKHVDVYWSYRVRQVFSTLQKHGMKWMAMPFFQ